MNSFNYFTPTKIMFGEGRVKEIGDVFFFIVSGLYVLVGILYFITRSRCIDKNFNGIPDELE